MTTPPCHGLLELFSATTAEIRRPAESDDYAEAKEVCRGCPMRVECAEGGLRYGDRHTIRAGLRLWVTAERAKLPDVAAERTYQ